MATYINIHGNNIPIRASDPSNPITGEIWYNTTTNLLKGHIYSTGTWSSGGNMSYAMGDGGMTRAGTITAALVWQGAPSPATGLNKTESYDGTTWTGKPNTPYAASGVGSFGTQTAAVGAGGQPGGGGVTTTIEWDGTNWGCRWCFTRLYGPGGNSHTTGAGTANRQLLCIGGIGDPPPSECSRLLMF